MNKIKSYTFFFWILLIWGGTFSVIACPCFNPIFLQSIFKDPKTTVCDIYREGDIVYKIDIYNDKYSASTSPTGCSLNTEFHDVNTPFYPDYNGEHAQCINEILYTCQTLQEMVMIRDE